jgi:acyl-CoA synthetase (AMP-forming)/AMP-acid ligase II
MGEIEIASPSVLRGYIDHASEAILPPAGDEDFWWPTGDVGLFRVAPSGATHLFLVDRIRDMIKVKVSEHAETEV